MSSPTPPNFQVLEAGKASPAGTGEPDQKRPIFRRLGPDWVFYPVVLVVGLFLLMVAMPDYVTSPPPSPRTRALQNLRIIHTALEGYRSEYSVFPPSDGLWRVTTPVAYLLYLPTDPFADSANLFHRYHTNGASFVVGSFGPDSDEKTGGDFPWSDAEAMNALLEDETRLLPFSYDPSNGTVSEGDIWRIGTAPTESKP